MYLDELEEQTVRNWMDFLKNNSLLKLSVSGETPTLISANKYSLSKYNVIKSSISFSGAETLSQYMPYDRNNNDSQISAIIVNGATGPFTVNYEYNPFALLTRSRKSIDQSLFETPKVFVLWSNSISMPYRRQTNDMGRRVTRRRGYITILVDVEDDQGGYAQQAKLLSLIHSAIEGGRDVLHDMGFEDIVVEEIPTNEDYDSVEPREISRGILMVAFTVYPEIRR